VRFLQAACPSHHPANRIKAMKAKVVRKSIPSHQISFNKRKNTEEQNNNEHTKVQVYLLYHKCSKYFETQSKWPQRMSIWKIIYQVCVKHINVSKLTWLPDFFHTMTVLSIEADTSSISAPASHILQHRDWAASMLNKSVTINKQSIKAPSVIVHLLLNLFFVGFSLKKNTNQFYLTTIMMQYSWD